MPKPRGGPFRALKRDTRYAAIIAAALPPHHDWNTPHITPVIADDERALDVQRGIYRSTRHLGDPRCKGGRHVKGCKCITAHHVITSCTGCGALLQAEHKARCSRPGWRVAFQLAPKSSGQAAIAEHVKNGGTLAYNLRRDK
jgi:hypothetical protein